TVLPLTRRTRPCRHGNRSSLDPQLSQNVLCEEVLDFTMAWNRLRCARFRILVPIVLAAVADQQTSALFHLADEINPFHSTASSAMLRTLGMSPLRKSRYKSRRFSSRSLKVSPCVR